MKVTFECNGLSDFLELKALLNVLYPATNLTTPKTNIDDIGLCVRTYNQLKVNGINTLDDLLQCTNNDILKLPHMGRKSFDDIITTIAKLGYTLKAN